MQFGDAGSAPAPEAQSAPALPSAADAARFQAPAIGRSVVQLAISLGGFVAVCAAMYLSLDISYWLALAMAPVAAGFLVRIFIIQHDCGHGSFFRAQWANSAIGFACGLLTLTPYAAWRRQHAGHHGVWNDLDRRQSGADIYSTCLTVAEYRALSPRARFWHRLTRHPLVLNVLLPPFIFLVLYRLPFDAPKSWVRERRHVQLTNAGLVLLLGGLGLTLGFGAVASVQLPVMVLAAMAGAWLFSVQHRYEHVIWARRPEWTFARAALQGSSYLRMPRLLQWFSGNIGFHHVHHLSPRIPNYRLEECHRALPGLAAVPVLTLRGGLRASRFLLWDEERGRMVPCAAALREG